MNIYANFIEDTKIKKVPLNTKEVLEGFIDELNNIKLLTANLFNKIKNVENQLILENYSIAYREETMSRLKDEVETQKNNEINSKITKMEGKLTILKNNSILIPGDKDIARNNIIKLNGVLPSLTIEDIKEIFNHNKEKDNGSLEVLYFFVKDKDASLALEILEFIEEYTGQREVNLVEQTLIQIKGLNSYLKFDYIQKLDVAYSSQIGVMVSGNSGGINRIIDSYIDDINRKIENMGL